VDETDGLSVEYDDWRFNVRMSNTEPVVRLNVETARTAVAQSQDDELITALETASEDGLGAGQCGRSRSGSKRCAGHRDDAGAEAAGADLVAFPDCHRRYPPENLLLKDHFISQSKTRWNAGPRMADLRGRRVPLGGKSVYNAAACLRGKICGCIARSVCQLRVFDEKATSRRDRTDLDSKASTSA